MARIFEYPFTNYQPTISLHEVANLVNTSRATFCRYFKQGTKRTYVDFLKEVHISHACCQLAESDKLVLRVCFESGYNSMTNFSKQFRELKKITPLQYKRQFQGEA